MKLLGLSKSAYRYYTRHTRDNENTSYEEAQKKLTRNVELATLLEPTEKQKQAGKKMYAYGNLMILVVNGEVVWLKNNHGITKLGYWQGNEGRYIELNRQLEIKRDNHNKEKIS